MSFLGLTRIIWQRYVIQIPALAAASGLSEEELERIVEDNTEGKLLGVFGEETVNVLGVNLDIAKAMGVVEEATK